MSQGFRIVVLATVAVVLCAATFLLVPYLRSRDNRSGDIELANAGSGQEYEPGMNASGIQDEPSTASPRTARPAARRASGSFADREKAKFDVGEMRREAEDMLQRFRGTDEERQEVIDECESGKELIRLFAELSESSIETMSPEELEEERESFERDYRAQLDFLQTGQLQRMLKTPEEQEVIGSTIEAVQVFLERIDDALHAAGY